MEKEEFPKPIFQEKKSLNHSAVVQLNEEEALDLATHLKEKLKAGLPIDADPQSIATMVAGLGDPRGLLRLRFADSLGSVGKAAVPSLSQAMLLSDQVTVRRAAAKTLTLISDPASLAALTDAFLNDEDSVVQGSAMGAMAAIGTDAVEAILSILKKAESSEMQIGLANWALAFIGDRAPEALRDAAQSTHPSVRKAAISALGSQIQSLDAQKDRDLLCRALSDSCSEIRSEAVTLIGNLEDAEWGESFLVKALSDSDSWVRKNSALSLMKLECTSSIPILLRLSEQESDPVVSRVMNLAIDRLQKSEDS
ncbi:putative phycoerythrin:phycoerythrobilin lyase [Synechococcus sp. BIOS-U3-1]|uniref:HEAT repeat domain-containing protein n=1 Tax=Synechococcus sp. BIOS-U3-1 TaxID=1400865 RepID=UPI000D0C54A2|nr:HEAT repeat domain-containing protein [Synechococcus sp. BIOS-U3-1]AVH76633.1 putative phycoerythrin:phycoerythrobilin lyase [Synechococcus sp. BIOS-U3-1]QNI57467.1 putative phycoerythrin:phycoerythrobilin lyase [Synechococcus sp. BIOS-U3-1]